MTEVDTINDLRSIAGGVGWPVNDCVEIRYVKGHTNRGDGGGGIFMWSTNILYTGPSPSYPGTVIGEDNNGTVIKNSAAPWGRWVRFYEGYLNVQYFGAFGVGNPYTTEIQKAIDYAYLLNKTSNPIKESTTVFFPNGTYIVSNLILKSGVSLLGENIQNTVIGCNSVGITDQYMFDMAPGPIYTQISNFFLKGNNTFKGCFHFKAQVAEENQGGLWNSRLSNIIIKEFQGHGIFLEGGENGLTPNQFNIFENIQITRPNSNSTSNSLRMSGQNGQHTFINCEFDGFWDGNLTWSKGKNIQIFNTNIYTTAVTTFINCSCQNSDYGFYIEYAENIKIDNCWFENLGVAITVKSSATVGTGISRGISLENNHFANSAGFGSLNAPFNIKSGQCVYVDKSFVSVNNNYVSVSDINSPNLNAGSSFLYANNNISCGVDISGNNFLDDKIAKTYGIMQSIPVAIGNTVDCAGHKIIFVNPSSISLIKTIKSKLNASQQLTIRGNIGTITFDNTGNIFLAGKTSLVVNNGDLVSFIKCDNTVGAYNETYQLISIVRSTS